MNFKIVLSLILLPTLLTSCVYYNACPDIVDYSKEEQKELFNILENNDNKVVEKFLIDYSNLRKNIRVCKKHE